MNPGKVIKILNDHEIPVDERRFLLVSTLSIIGVFIVFVIDLILGENPGETWILGITCIVVPPIINLSFKYHKTRLGAWILGLGIVCVVMPVTFFSGGGLYGGAVIWLSFVYMYIALVMKGKARWVLAGILTAEVITEYYFVVNHLHEPSPHSIRMAYIDSLLSIIVVGVVIMLVVTFQNMVLKKENEFSLKQAKEIEELNRSQNRFFSSMSHEIRTPINTIIGLNEMILREDIPEEVAEDALNIQAASRMLLTTINDILDMSKIESGRMEIIPVVYRTGDMLSAIVGMIWLKAKEKGLEFHIDVDQTLPSQLYGDEVRIKQILINVLNNAIKYTDQGSVTLSIQWRKAEGKKAVIIYSVTDTGKGIRKESMPYLFSAFKRVDEQNNRNIEGTGLGLSIVKQFTDLMGGTVNVNSVYMQGSTFVIELPQEIADDAGVGDLRIEARHSISARKHYKQSFEAPDAHILVVDDNDTNLLVVTKLLRDTKVVTDTASSGNEALNKCLQLKYDAIFMDHLMPDMDGIECLKQIRLQVGGLNKETPVVALTANAGSDMQAVYNKAGFDGYLLKPVTGELLEAELLRLLPRELVRLTSDIELEELNMSKKHMKKASILITTDSVCDLPPELAKHYGVSILPYSVYTDEGSFLDGVETETDGILSYIEDKSRKAYSVAPTPGQYENFFSEQLGKAQNIVHITMTRTLSDGYKNALEASASFNNVHVIDSEHLSGGLGLLVIFACRRIREDITLDILLSQIDEAKKRIHTSFMVDTTEYLYRVGRISSKINAISKAFMIHPVLTMKKGRMVATAGHIGTLKSAREKYINACLDVLTPINKRMVFIEYCGMSYEEVEEVRQRVSEKVKFEKTFCHQASPTIASNCGPGTFGIIYMLEK